MILATSCGHAGIVKLLSEPKPSFSFLIGTAKALEGSSPEPPTCLAPSKPILPAARLLFVIVIPFFVIISSIFLFYLFALFGPSLSALSFQSLYR